MKFSRTFLLFTFIVIIQKVFGQTYMDPAQSYNLLDIQNNSGKYTVIGNYKVIGTLYLFGGNKKGNIYARNEYGNDVVISYNTYLQQLEFDMDGKKGLVKELQDVDSFILKADGDYFLTDLFFINASLIGSNEKCFFQKVSEGSRYDLYKKFYSKLDIVTTNYVQSELRQFSLATDFFYYDKINKTVKKLKLNKKAIVNEFKDIKDLSGDLKNANISVDTENLLKAIFLKLNQ